MSIRQPFLTSLMIFFATSLCSGNPSGGQVTAGAAAIQQANGQMTITQSTDRAIIQWQNFSIGAGETVRFIQPSALSAALNRVVGVDPSLILGTLRANGQIFLVNPNGVFFSPGSTVDVSGLVVSTLNITDNDFLNQSLNFTQDASKELAAIVNQGTLKVDDNGFVVLASPLISNEGLILAKQGRVALAAGEQTSISFDPNNLVHFEVANLPAGDSTVLLPQDAVSNVLKGVVSNPKLADSTELVLIDGEYELRNGSGIALNSGQITVDAASGVKAGNVRIDSTRATVMTATGGISAKGTGAYSHGGDIYLLSKGQTAALKGSTVDIGAGDIGNGGFAELSGGTILAGLTVKADVSQGTRGTYLIDPTILTVANGPNLAAPDTVYEDDLQSSVVDIALLADETIFIEDIADDQITLVSDLNLDITTTDGLGDGVVFEDPDDEFRTFGTGKIFIDTAGALDGGRFVSDDSVTVLAEEVGADPAEVPYLSAPLVAISATGDVRVETTAESLFLASDTGFIAVSEFDDVFLSSVTADRGVNITAGGNINGGFTAGDNSLLFATNGTIGSEGSPVSVDIDGDLLVQAGDEVNGRSGTLTGTVTDGVLAVNTTPGDVVFNGSPVDDFVNVAELGDLLDDVNDEDIVDLAGRFGLPDDDIEDLQEQLSLAALGEHHRPGDFGDFGDGPDGFDGPDDFDGFDGPDDFDGPEGPDHMEGPDGEDQIDGPDELGDKGGDDKDSGDDKDEKRERRNDKNRRDNGRSPIIAQAGLGRQNLTTAALVRFRVEALPQLTVNVDVPSPFDLALQQSQVTADDILDFSTSDLNNFDVNLSYDILGDPILINPALRAGDLFELNVGDLSEVPVDVDR